MRRSCNTMKLKSWNSAGYCTDSEVKILIGQGDGSTCVAGLEKRKKH